MTPFEKALNIVSDGNQTRFAAAVNEQVKIVNAGSQLLERPIPKLSQQLVHCYLRKGVPCAAHFVPIISNLTKGEVSMHELRPDVYPVPQEAA